MPRTWIVVIAGVLAAPATSIKATKKSISYGDQNKPIFYGDQVNLDDVNNMTKFVMIANHRTGSTMLVNLLGGHPEIVIDRRELFQGTGGTGSCNRQLNLEGCANYAIGHNVDGKFDPHTQPIASVRAFGLKLMMDQIYNINGSVMDPNFKYVLHWRRNVLRTIISDDPGTYGANPRPHVFDEAGALRVRGKRAHVSTHNLTGEIDERLFYQCNLRKFLGDSVEICPSYYEDWIDPRTRTAQMQRIQACLGVHNVNLVEHEQSIQEVYPILDTVSNPEEVERTLRGTKYEYMLEDAALSPRPELKDGGDVEYGYLDAASSAAVFDNLKASDSFCS